MENKASGHSGSLVFLAVTLFLVYLSSSGKLANLMSIVKSASGTVTPTSTSPTTGTNPLNPFGPSTTTTPTNSNPLLSPLPGIQGNTQSFPTVPVPGMPNLP
jgi:hypothetical protein